jgi:hypothetical protein
MKTLKLNKTTTATAKDSSVGVAVSLYIKDKRSTLGHCAK